MKLTDDDRKMFNVLRNSPEGDALVQYLERLKLHVCDARTWEEGDSRESALQASRAIEIVQKHLRTVPNTSGEVSHSTYI